MDRSKPVWIASLAPTIGIVCFATLYFYASTLYPGGSQANASTPGFDWINNYWCNLLNATAMNGQPNPGKPYAIAGMAILCFSLSIFFIQFAQKYSTHRSWKILVEICGVLAMIFAFLLFTQYHDFVTILSSVFGLVAIAGIVRALSKSTLHLHKFTGVLCLVLLALNNIVYYSHQYLALLPLLQKVTFAIVLGWVISLNLKMTFTANTIE